MKKNEPQRERAPVQKEIGEGKRNVERGEVLVDTVCLEGGREREGSTQVG